MLNRFETSKLYKKLVCQLGEISHKELKETQTFKKLTGGDLMRIEFKGKDCFDDYSYAKLLIATNKLPESPDKTKGYFDRWIIIDFARTFPEKPDLLVCIPLGEYEALARKSILLLPKLLKKGVFTMEGDTKEKALRYEQRASPVTEFLKESCVDDINAETPFWQFFKEYFAFCSQRSYRLPTKMEVSLLLQTKSYSKGVKYYKKDTGVESTMKTIIGLRLRSE